MSRAPEQPQDPLRWCAVLALGFWLACLPYMFVVGHAYFDEIHYLPAARDMLELGSLNNKEHPLFGKELLAAGIWLFGDNPYGWRIIPSLAGALTLFAAMRALWFATLSRFATIGYGVLLATGFHLFVHARIAMLDIFYLVFLALALWQAAAAMREPETGRWRLALCGAALGLAMASKWNAIPIAVVPGLAFLALRWNAGRRRLLLSRRGAPVPGITLVEAALWLGVVPLAVYAATFAPGYFYEHRQIIGLIAHHEEMLSLQTQVLEAHPYMSTWPEWMLNLRAIWYLYEAVDGVQRGVLLIGNPLTMIAGLAGVAWCVWEGFVRGRSAHFAAALLYLVSLGFWIVAAKPVQFYYHYSLPAMFLLAALALALDDLRKAGPWGNRAAYAVLALSVGMFFWFYPILSAAPLEGQYSFLAWTWLESWQ